MNRYKKEQERLRKRQARQNKSQVQSLHNIVELVGTEDTEISDNVVDAMLTLLKANCLPDSQLCIDFYSPAEIHLLENDQQVTHRQIPRDKDCVLIYPLQRHWVTSYYDSSLQQVFIYDSLQTESHLIQIKKQILLIYGNEFSKNLKYVPVQQQNVLPECGVMAIAFAVSILLHIDPVTLQLDLSKARAHLKACLSSRVIQPFPVIQGQKKK